MLNKMNKLILISLLLLFSVSITFSKEPIEVISKHPTIISMYVINSSIRKEYMLPEQKLNEQLCKHAQLWAQQMAKKDKLTYSKLPYRENIASEQKVIVEVFNYWKTSEGYKKNILSNTEFCGFGMARSEDKKEYWCAMYTNLPVKDKKP